MKNPTRRHHVWRRLGAAAVLFGALVTVADAKQRGALLSY